MARPSTSNDRVVSRLRGNWPDLRWQVAPFAGAWATTVVLVVVTVIAFPDTLGFGGLATLTPLIGVLIIAALGQALVIGTGGVDLSSSAVMTLSGVLLIKISHSHDSSLASALVVALLLGLAAGLANGIAVEYLGLNSLVATLAVGEVITGVSTVLLGNSQGATVPPAWGTFTGHTLHGVSIILGISVVLAAVLSVVVSRTPLGRRFTASSVSVAAGRYNGLAVRRYRCLAYVGAGLLYSFSGLLLGGEIGSPTITLGDPYQLAVIVAVVLGGATLTGGRLHPGATLAGAVFLALIDQDVAAAGWSTGAQEIVQGLVIVGAIVAPLLAGSSVLRRRRLRRSMEASAGSA